MISRPSFRNFFLQQLKQYVWVLIAALYLSGAYVLEFATAQKGVYLFRGDERLGPQNATMYYITIVLAVACAVQGFAMLFSEKKMAFYFGMPVSRKWLFLTNYLCGCVVGLLPCVLSRAVCYFLRSSTIAEASYLTGMGIVVSSIGFLFIYHLAIVIMLLTGRAVAAVGGVILAAVYGHLLIGFTLEKYSEVFFATYYKSNIVALAKTYLSPLGLYKELAGINEYAMYEEWLLRDKSIYVAVMILILILAFAAALILFQRRPAESAGRTLAFRQSRTVIKVAVAIPISLMVGYFVMQCSLSTTSLPLLVFGILLGAFATNGMMEIAFQADARKVLSKKSHAVVIAVIGILAAGTFYFDVWNYDLYMPDKKELQSVAVGIRGLEDTVSLHDAVVEDRTTEKRMEAMQLEGLDMERTLDWVHNISKEQRGKPITYVTLGYKKSEENIIYRRYKITSTKQLDAFAAIYESEAYKSSTISLALEKTVAQQRFTWTNGVETYRLAYTEQDTQQLLDCYRADLAECKLSDIKARNPISTLTLTDWAQSGGRGGYIYPSFQRTIAFLQQRDIPANKALGDYDIERVDIIADKTVVITNQSKISQLKSKLLYEPLAINQVFVPVSEERVQVECRDVQNNTFEVVECRIKRD